MLINGAWRLENDGILRPIIHGEVLNASGLWEEVPFLVDTGADLTVFSAAVFSSLRLPALPASQHLGGISGTVTTASADLQFHFHSVDLGPILFRGRFPILSAADGLDMCVLGRDLLNNFAVIVDRRRDVVCLLGQRHQYRIEHI
jgi:hypothetical protein